jgi:hypothetical protein
MAWGDGSLYRRKDGRWCGQLSVGGKRLYVYGRSRREALMRLAALRERARQGLPRRPRPRAAEPQPQGQTGHERPGLRLRPLGRVRLVPIPPERLAALSASQSGETGKVKLVPVMPGRLEGDRTLATE